MGLHQKMQVVLLRGEKREIVSKYIPFYHIACEWEPALYRYLCVYVCVRMPIMSMSSDGC